MPSSSPLATGQTNPHLVIWAVKQLKRHLGIETPTQGRSAMTGTDANGNQFAVLHVGRFRNKLTLKVTENQTKPVALLGVTLRNGKPELTEASVGSQDEIKALTKASPRHLTDEGQFKCLGADLSEALLTAQRTGQTPVLTTPALDLT